MKKLILLSIVSLSALISSAQCSADFTWSSSGNTVYLTNTSIGTNNNDWSFGDGGSSSVTNPTYTYSSPGSYNICLYSYYVDSLGGFCSDSICHQVMVLDSNVQCSADFTWSVSGSTVYLTNTSIGTNNNDWSFGDGGSSSATNPTHTYSSPGSYNICLYSYYVDSMGGFCDDSVCYQVTIIDSIATGCTVGASIYGSGNQIIGTNTSMNAGIYSWSVSDYNSGASLTNVNTTDLNYSPGYYGDFLVCLTAYDSTGMLCDTLCNLVTLLDTITPPCNTTADFTWSSSGNTVYLTNTSIGTNNNDWSFGDGGSSSATNPTHTYSSPGSYNICLYSYYVDSMGGFCDDSVCYQVTIIDSMVTGCTVGASIYGSGNQIVGTNTSMNAGIYSWSVSDYNSGTSLTNVNTTDLNYSPGYYGDFLVCLTAYDSTGALCDTICDIITLSDSLDSTANVTFISINEFQLYPNPTNAVLNIRFDHLPSNAHARLVDLLGREMVEVDLTTQVTEIQVADFPSGIYFVQLIDANNQIMGMHKFVRE